MSRDGIPESPLAELVARHVDVEPASLELRRCSTGKFNTSYFIDGGPTPVVIRVAPLDDRSRMLVYEHRMIRQEPALRALVRSRTGVSAAAVLAHDFTGRLIDRDYLLIQRLPSTPRRRRAWRSPSSAPRHAWRRGFEPRGRVAPVKSKQRPAQVWIDPIELGILAFRARAIP
jgi:hypothetical protein